LATDTVFNMSEVERKFEHDGRPPEQFSSSRASLPRLCARCAAIDFKAYWSQGYGTLDVESSISWAKRDCDFCELLSLVKDRQTPEETPMHLWHIDLNDALNDLGVIGYALSTMQPGGSKDGFSSCTLKSKDYDFPSFLVRTPFDLSSKMTITPPMIDFDLVKGWLRTSTIDALAVEPTTASAPTSAVPTSEEDLRVIDCKSRSLVWLPPHAQYVTLSYVWGSQSEDLGVPPHFPPTIQDSVKVCLALEYRYLWVDRYCIPQAHSEERNKQIQRMDEIYQSSVLTIVAAAGRTPLYGLPGVTKVRSQHSSSFINGVGYLQRIPHYHDIKTSPWAQRGWTYQETLLSQARLYFTDTQLYFENSATFECEWASLAGKNSGEDRSSMMLYSPATWSGPSTKIYDCIWEFSVRSLSFPSDRLNALLGIFAVFERKCHIRHLSGLPFATENSPSTDMYPRPMPTFLSSLFFQSPQESVRCHDFPSWSWAAWSGRKIWPFWSNLNPFDTDFDPNICVELSPGNTINLAQHQSSLDGLKHQPANAIRFIHIKAYVSNIIGHRKSTRSDFKYDQEVHSIEFSDGVSFEIDIPFSEHWLLEAMDEHDLGSFIIMRFPDDERSFGSFHIVLRDLGTFWERVGCLCGRYKDADANDMDRRFWPGSLRTIRLG
jgi:hypothetical protein